MNAAAAIARLCQDCGLCCDGTLFGEAVVEPGEIEALAARGFPILRDADGASFPQPCACLENRRCTAYAARPRSCIAYECRVVTDLRAGLIDESEARRRTAQAHAAAARLRALLPAGDSPASARDRANRHAREHAESAGAPPDPREHLLTAALCLLLERHFLPEGTRLLGFRPLR